MFGCRENLIMKLANNNNRIINFCQIEDNFFFFFVKTSKLETTAMQCWSEVTCLL